MDLTIEKFWLGKSIDMLKENKAIKHICLQLFVYPKYLLTLAYHYT